MASKGSGGAGEPGDLRPGRHDWGGLRSALTWGWVGALGLVSFALALLVLLAGGLLWDRERRALHAVAALWGGGLARTLLPGAVVRGAEHCRGGPFVIVANHQSVIDLLVLYLLPLPYRTLVKRSWFYTPLGLNMWAAGYIPTAHTNALSTEVRALDGCRRWLDRGVSVLCFPEGRRARGWTVGRFKRGAFELAVEAGVPLLPVALAGTNDASHPSSWRFSYGRSIILEVLPPVAAGGRTAKELAHACAELLGERVAALRDELRQVKGQGPVART